MNTAAHFNLQLRSLQMTILIIHVFVMGIGGCVFGLGVAIRPILRLTKQEDIHVVRSICDLMISISITQLCTAGLNCLSGCWKIIWTLYLAMGMTILVILLEMAGMATSFYVLAQIDELVNEQVPRAWFIWECKKPGSCNAAMTNYVHHYMMPQTVLTMVAVILQCLAILYLSRCVRCLNEKHMEIWKTHDDNNLTGYKAKNPDIFDIMDIAKRNKEANDSKELVESIKSRLSSFSAYDPPEGTSKEGCVEEYTPNSILKGDHGYVMASNSSINFDDNYANQSQKETPSISFNHSVQVHYFHAKDEARSPAMTYCTPTTSAPDDNLNNISNIPNSPMPGTSTLMAVDGICTKEATAAGICENVSLSGGGSSCSSGSAFKEAISPTAKQLVKMLSIASGSRRRSRKYSVTSQKSLSISSPVAHVSPSTPVELTFTSHPASD